MTSIGNIHVNPLFVNPEKGDYHLLEGSPAKDVGHVLAPEDLDGTRADMGAFYFHHDVVSAVDEANIPNRFEVVSTAPNPFTSKSQALTLSRWWYMTFPVGPSALWSMVSWSQETTVFSGIGEMMRDMRRRAAYISAA